MFVANKGCVLTYDQIYRKVWEEEAFGNANNAIACHVHNLREKIGRLLPEGCFVIRFFHVRNCGITWRTIDAASSSLDSFFCHIRYPSGTER